MAPCGTDVTNPKIPKEYERESSTLMPGRKPVGVVDSTLRKETSGCKFRGAVGADPCGNRLLAESLPGCVLTQDAEFIINRLCLLSAAQAASGHQLTEETLLLLHPAHAGSQGRPKSARFTTHPLARVGFLVFRLRRMYDYQHDANAWH